MSTEQWKKDNREKVLESKRRWYQKNKEKHKQSRIARDVRLREEYIEFKKTLSCSRCPEDHIACLEFHHLDPCEKDMGIAAAMTNGWSMKRIKKEVAKCIVLCSNCHRKEHYDLKHAEL